MDKGEKRTCRECKHWINSKLFPDWHGCRFPFPDWVWFDFLRDADVTLAEGCIVFKRKRKADHLRKRKRKRKAYSLPCERSEELSKTATRLVTIMVLEPR